MCEGLLILVVTGLIIAPILDGIRQILLLDPVVGVIVRVDIVLAFDFSVRAVIVFILQLPRDGPGAPGLRQLQNKHFDGEDALVKGQNYKYAHDYDHHWVKQQYLPDALKDVKYYTYGDNRTEQAARAYWAKIKGEENV